MRILRRILQVLLTLLFLVAIGVCVVAFNAYRAVPRDVGTMTLAKGAIAKPVTITRDERGVPTIEAASEDDAYFALGYVHAQDRLFQMELMRRSGQGRLSEIIGKLGLNLDRYIRTLGLYRRAEADFAGLDPAVQRAFQRYADGVNAWLTQRDRPLPLEFHILWFTPEPWKPADSLVWQKLMGLQLAGNSDEELLRAALDAKLGPMRAEDLFPAPRAGDPATVESVATPMKETRAPHDPSLAALAPDRLLDVILNTITPTLASNAFAVAGSRTASGQPLLANDPHLGFEIPSLWYLAVLKTPDITLSGATVPGVPLHVLGQNQHIAWGITTTHGDTQDLFIEHVLAGGKSYETPDGPQDFVTRVETIPVRFGDSVQMTVRETRHGPVLSDVLRAGRVPVGLLEGDRVLALSAALFQPNDRTAEALYRMAHAQDAVGFRDALRLFEAPQQNITFADRQSIGFVAAGRVPIRKAGNGTIPAPGWSGDYDWIGWAPFEQLPQAMDPASGMIVNANNRISAADDPLIAVHWHEAYRARRILAALGDAKAPLTVDDLIKLQNDAVSIPATEMLPLLLPHVTPRTDDEKALLATLQTWDGDMAVDRAEPLVFAVWMDRLKYALVADDLGDLYARYYGERADALRAMLEGGGPGLAWCDDVATSAQEPCAARIQLAWNDTIDWIGRREGASPASWRWGNLHQAVFGHQVFETLPILGRLSTRAIPTPGGEYTVNRGSHLNLAADQPLKHVHGPGIRAVYDLADPTRSRFALAGGQSGYLASPHYDDLLRPWRDGENFPLNPPESGKGSSLTLVPGP